MADAKKGIPKVGGALQVIANATGQKKKKPGRVRMHEGFAVRPLLFDGRAGGHGKYYSGYVDDKSQKDATAWDLCVKDEDGVPVPLRQIGTLV